MFRSFRFVLFALGAFAMWTAFSGMPASAEPLGVNEVPATPTLTPTPQAGSVLIEDAAKLFNARRYDEAVKTLEKACAADSKLPPPQTIMADWFGRINQPTPMRQALELAVKNYPADPQAYIVFGNLALSDGRITDAAMEFAKAQDLLKTFKIADRKKILEPATIVGMAKIAEARQRWEEAQKQFEAYLVLNPKDTGATQELANALFQQQDAAGALKTLRKAAELDAKSVLTPEATLALFYERFGDHKNAIVWMNVALQKAPDDLRTLLAATRWALDTGQLDEAKKHAAKAMQIDPKSNEARMLRGVVALFLKDYKGAEEDFYVILAQLPSNFGAKNNLALALCEQKDELKGSRALDYATENAKLNPKSPEALSTLGWVYYRLGKLSEADQCLKGAVSGGNYSPDTVYYLAQVSYDLGRKEDAKALLDMVMRTERPFYMRQEVRDLLEKINKEPAKKP